MPLASSPSGKWENTLNKGETMNKEEKSKLREEAEKESLTVEDIIAIRQLHGAGRTNTEIGMGLDLHVSTVSAALSRGLHPLKESDDDSKDSD